ncbi:MAG: hypothetical protein RL322_1672 [Pseudomonadota bacterium]
MRGVQLDRVKSDSLGATRRVDEGSDQRLQILMGECGRGRLILTDRDRARGDPLPTACTHREQLATLPRSR